MPAFLNPQQFCRKLLLPALALLVYAGGPKLARAQVPTPTIVPGNCASSYPVRSGLQFDLVFATQDTSNNFWYDDQDSFTKHSEFFAATSPSVQTVSFTTVCVGDDVRWEEPATQSTQSHTSTQGTMATSICSTAHSENPLWDIVDCVQNPTSNLMVASTIYCPAAGTCPGSSPNPFFTTQGIFQYYCRAHLTAMEGYVIVNPYATSVSLSGGTNGTYGTASTFTATVSSSPSRGGAPNAVGTVQLFVNGNAFGSAVTVNASGVATFSNIVLPGGTNSVTAVYNGDGNKYAKSPASNTQSVTITPASASVSLIPSQNPAPPGTNITFTATVTDNSGITPPGASETVQLLDGTTVLGTMAFQGSAGNQGTYAFSTNTLAAGTHSITAVLQAGNFSSATSNVVNEAIEDFSIAISNSPGIVRPGTTFTFNGTLNSVGGYTGNVAISCTGGTTAPPATCTPVSSPVHVSSGATNVPFSVNASNPTAATFTFNIHGQDTVTSALAHDVPVTLNVATFTLTAPSPSTASIAAGNPSGLISFSAQAQGAPDSVTMTCTAVAGITCTFPNGAASEMLQLPVGQSISGDFTINVASSVAAGTYTLTLKATDQTGVVKTGTVSVTVAVPTTAVVFNASFITPAPANTVPGMVGSYTFNPRASVAFASPNGVTNATMLITFDQPVFIMSTTNPGSCAIDNVNSTVLCNLGSIAVGGGFNTKITIQPAFGVRNITLVNQLSCAEKNNGTNLAHATVQIRPRPEVHNNIPAR